MLVKAEGVCTKCELYTLVEFRILENAEDACKVFNPMFLKFMKLTIPEASLGTSSRCAGVTTRSSSLFWYIRHKVFVDKVLLEEKLYCKELPTNDE